MPHVLGGLRPDNRILLPRTLLRCKYLLKTHKCRTYKITKHFIFQWDTCRCEAHCKIRRAIQRKEKHEQEKNINENKIKQEELYKYSFNVEKDPQTKIINEGNDEVYYIRRKKQLNFGEKERAKDAKL